VHGCQTGATVPFCVANTAQCIVWDSVMTCSSRTRPAAQSCRIWQRGWRGSRAALCAQALCPTQHFIGITSPVASCLTLVQGEQRANRRRLAFSYPPRQRTCCAESNRILLVLIGMRNWTFGPFRQP
jgi:hypothetical protein